MTFREAKTVRYDEVLVGDVVAGWHVAAEPYEVVKVVPGQHAVFLVGEKDEDVRSGFPSDTLTVQRPVRRRRR
jgi:hypothetical protein